MKKTIRPFGKMAASLAIASLFLAACGNDEGPSGNGNGESEGGDPPAPSGEPLQFFLSGDGNQGGGFAALSEKYEEETGVKVEIIDLANQDLPTKIKNAALADDLPALANIGAIDPVWKDMTVDLTPIVEATNVRTDLATIGPDGRVFGLPSDITAVGLFLNKTLFEEAGVSYPADESEIWTWDEFEAAVKEVQEKTGTTYGMVMDRSSHRLKSFLYEFGSTSFQPDADGNFQTNEETYTALEHFKSLNDDSFMPKSVWLSDGDPNALFKSGDVVSYYSGSWQIADFAKNIQNFEWASTYLPMQPVRAAQYGNAATIVVFDGTGQEQEALDFLTWLYSDDQYSELSQISGFLPAVEGLEIDYTYNKEEFDLYNQEIEASDPIVSEIKQMEIAYQIKGVATEGDPIRDETIRYLNDEQDLDTTVENIKNQMSEQLGALD